MPQFDVFSNPRNRIYPLLVDLQADDLARLETRVVAPLVRRDRYAQPVITRLTPNVGIDGVEYVVLVQMSAAISRSQLGKSVGSLAAQRTELIAAIDLLFTGS